MKKILNLILTVLFTVIVFNGCEDKTDLTPPSPKSGNVDLSRYVAIGNSITAGFQSGALYQSAQIYSYGNLIAQQVNSAFAIPYISDPGLGGRMEIKSFDIANGVIVITNNTNSGAPLNSGYPNSFNNLGIPGALLYDVLNATNGTTSASYLFGNPATRRPNSFFDIILRSRGTQFSQARSLKPTFISVWIGNNDVLGFATSGGFSPSSPTPSGQFQALYNQLGDSLASLGAKVVVANIPDVTSIPFFTTVGPKLALQTPWPVVRFLGAPGLIYQKHGETIATGVADSSALFNGAVLITLTGGNYATLIGKPTGQFYRDNLYPALPPGIDTTKPFGLHPQNPWPDALILDPSEIQTAKSSTSDFNAAIKNVAQAKGFALVDINTVFNNIRSSDFSGGTFFNGLSFTTQYFIGGLFGLDGVHPTSQGQAIIANEFLKVINATFNASYPYINVASIPGSIVLAKRGIFTKVPLPYFAPGSFDHLLF